MILVFDKWQPESNDRKTVADLLGASKIKRKVSTAEEKRDSKLQEMISDLENNLHV